MDVKNKTILVTGAASGLGRATADHLSLLGARVVACDLIQASPEIFSADVTKEEDVQAVLDSISQLHGVVNCAGVVQAARLVGKQGVMPLADFQQVIQVNLVGTFNVMRLAANKISAQEPVTDSGERGVIINTASIAAFEGQLGQVAYAASKGAVAAMTLPAARELSRFGIRVMTIAPGVMQTPMMDALSDDVQTALSADIPFPKSLGDPADYAKTAAHIIENSYLNGTTIRLDGALRLK